ncbi:peroxidasin-like [Haliotis asinina]|uniref:peroxidasin-like n=1 Tax=Haliotis asinina TaxID=109174 RepID=UPI0035323E63
MLYKRAYCTGLHSEEQILVKETVMKMLLTTLCFAGIIVSASGFRHVQKGIPEMVEAMKTFSEGNKSDVIFMREKARVSERIARHCDEKLKYRPLDGVCNNLENPHWGAPLQAFRRILDPKYDDDLGRPRLFGGNTEPLPSARAVSVGCLNLDSKSTKDRVFNQMMMQWGQFLDHDLTATPETEAESCCSGMSANGVHSDSLSNGPCFPIPIPAGDRQFKNCMEFSRSRPLETTSESCHREQLNLLTAYIDGSNVYGGSKEEADKLRTFRSGQLASTMNGQRLPITNQTTCLKGPGHSCFDAGDVRVNEFPGLTSMHTLWMREHNRIAKQLSSINRKWNDEKLFQEARQIVIASMQHITYTAWLPHVLGEMYNLFDLSRKYQYNSSVNPGIFNSFATAAFRFGHSMLASDYAVKGNRKVEIRKMFFDTSFVTKGYDDVLRGLMKWENQGTDRAFTQDIVDHLFENTVESGVGFDLVSLNIQRGRDHGLPPYLDFVNHISKIPSMKKLFSEDLAVPRSALNLYNCINDVDLFVGGISEKSVKRGLLGPTFGFILGKQFESIRLGDRFWYERADKDRIFTPVQLAQIRRTSLARVICDNSNIHAVPRDVFKRTRHTHCRHVPGIHLAKWRG